MVGAMVKDFSETADKNRIICPMAQSLVESPAREILFVGGDFSRVESFRAAAAGEGEQRTVSYAYTAAEASALLRQRQFAAVLGTAQLPDKSGAVFLDEVLLCQPAAARI